MMESKKKLPTALAKKQELQRQETINKVLRACANIKSEGGKVAISALVEHTRLSRSTFSKPHIRDVLAEHGYSSGDGVPLTSKGKKTKWDEVIAEKDRQIATLRAKNAEIERECELLRGRLFLLMDTSNK